MLITGKNVSENGRGYGHVTVFGRPFVKRFALCYRPLSCLSACLSVTFVHCGQTVGRIKIKLGMQVGLGPGHIGHIKLYF